MNLFPTLGTLLANTVVLVVLFFLLKRFGLNKIMTAMRDRAKRIKDDLTIAAQNKQASDELLNTKREELLEAREEAKEILTAAAKQKEVEGKVIITAAETEADRVLTEAQTTIKAEQKEAFTELRDDVSTLVAQLSAKVLGEQVTIASQERLVDQYLEQVEKLSPAKEGGNFA